MRHRAPPAAPHRAPPRAAPAAAHLRGVRGDRRAATALGRRRACRVVGARVPIGSSLHHARARLGLLARGPPSSARSARRVWAAGGSQGVARPSLCARGRSRVASAPPLFARRRGLDRGE
eukprot:5759073-Prymnesium_polylepis.1